MVNLFDKIYTEALSCSIETLNIIGEFATEEELKIITDYVWHGEQEKETKKIINKYEE